MLRRCEEPELNYFCVKFLIKNVYTAINGQYESLTEKNAYGIVLNCISMDEKPLFRLETE